MGCVALISKTQVVLISSSTSELHNCAAKQFLVVTRKKQGQELGGAVGKALRSYN